MVNVKRKISHKRNKRMLGGVEGTVLNRVVRGVMANLSKGLRMSRVCCKTLQINVEKGKTNKRKTMVGICLACSESGK